MRFFIVETRVPSGGHKMEFDRILIEELRNLGRNVALALPRNVAPKLDYGVEIYRLSSQAATLPVKGSLPAGLLRSMKSESRRQNIYAEIANLSEEYDGVVLPAAPYRFLRALRLNKLKNSKKAVVFIGETFSPGGSADFARALGNFVDNFDANADKYSQALAAALEYYHPRRLAKSIEAVAEKCQ